MSDLSLFILVANEHADQETKLLLYKLQFEFNSFFSALLSRAALDRIGRYIASDSSKSLIALVRCSRQARSSSARIFLPNRRSDDFPSSSQSCSVPRSTGDSVEDGTTTVRHEHGVNEPVTVWFQPFSFTPGSESVLFVQYTTIYFIQLQPLRDFQFEQ